MSQRHPFACGSLAVADTAGLCGPTAPSTRRTVVHFHSQRTQSALFVAMIAAFCSPTQCRTVSLSLLLRFGIPCSAVVWAGRHARHGLGPPLRASDPRYADASRRQLLPLASSATTKCVSHSQPVDSRLGVRTMTHRKEHTVCLPCFAEPTGLALAWLQDRWHPRRLLTVSELGACGLAAPCEYASATTSTSLGPTRLLLVAAELLRARCAGDVLALAGAAAAAAAAVPFGLRGVLFLRGIRRCPSTHYPRPPCSLAAQDSSPTTAAYARQRLRALRCTT
eukprot:COSAG02_NODE_3939_length_6012_cov_129.782006_5_plen_280_part_00